MGLRIGVVLTALLTVALMGVCVAMAVGQIIDPEGDPDKDGVPNSRDRCPHGPVALETAKGAKERANKGWNSEKTKKSGEAIKRVRTQSRCAPNKDGRKFVKDHIDKARAEYERAVEREERRKKLAKYTPYDCGSAGSYAVPCSIVACESGYSWSAYNPSGAKGAYQLLDKPVPWPVNGWKDKLAHHKYAAYLWAGGSGSSHWAQCL